MRRGLVLSLRDTVQARTQSLSSSGSSVPIVAEATDNGGEKKWQRKIHEKQQAATVWHAATAEETTMESTIIDWATVGDGVNSIHGNVSTARTYCVLVHS